MQKGKYTDYAAPILVAPMEILCFQYYILPQTTATIPTPHNVFCT